MYWSSKELLESNNLLAGWSGFELRSTPLQSKKITDEINRMDNILPILTDFRCSSLPKIDLVQN